MNGSSIRLTSWASTWIIPGLPRERLVFVHSSVLLVRILMFEPFSSPNFLRYRLIATQSPPSTEQATRDGLATRYGLDRLIRSTQADALPVPACVSSSQKSFRSVHKML